VDDRCKPVDLRLKLFVDRSGDLSIFVLVLVQDRATATETAGRARLCRRLWGRRRWPRVPATRRWITWTARRRWRTCVPIVCSSDAEAADGRQHGKE